MVVYEQNSEQAYSLLKEIQKLISVYPTWQKKEEFPNVLELRTSLRTQLAGLIYVDTEEWIDYSDIEFLKESLFNAIKNLENADSKSPFYRRILYTYSNLLTLYQSKCKHIKTHYSSLRGSPYQSKYCDDCKLELSSMEFKPSFLKKHDIDLSKINTHTEVSDEVSGQLGGENRSDGSTPNKKRSYEL